MIGFSVKLEMGKSLTAKVNRKVSSLARTELHVGIVEPQEHVPSGLQMAQLMAIHEWGAPLARIPERSILRAGLAQERKAVLHTMLAQLRLALASKSGTQYDRKALKLAGRLLLKRMKARFGSKDLKPNVVDVGLPGPLLDTGALRKAFKFKVVSRDDTPT